MIFRQAYASRKIIVLRLMFMYCSWQLVWCQTCPDLSSRGVSTPLFISKGGEVIRKVTESVTTRSQSLLYLYLPILHIVL
jgi:hypothetical protein